jgi:hypothetical protein
MRRLLLAVSIVLLLVVLDAAFNGYRFTGGIYREIAEFGRVVNRTIGELF